MDNKTNFREAKLYVNRSPLPGMNKLAMEKNGGTFAVSAEPVPAPGEKQAAANPDNLQGAIDSLAKLH